MPRHNVIVPPEDASFSLTFGGGINIAESPYDIDPQECTSGANFEIGLDRTSFRPRPVMMGIDPPGAGGFAYRGVAQYLEYEDGVPGSKAIVHTLLQTASNFYTLTFAPSDTSAVPGNSQSQQGQVRIAIHTFSGSPATVSGSSYLRGFPDIHTTEVDKGVIITDLALETPVLLWKPLDNTLEKLAPGITGDFYAKYCFVENNRAWFQNIRTGSTYTPHMVVASAVDDVTTVSVSNKPSSALGDGDPFYFLTPDFSAATQGAPAFGELLFPTTGKNVYILSGNNSKDYQLLPLYGGAGGVTSDQAVTFAENDIAYANDRGLQSLAGIQAFGDVENDDLSRKVKPAFNRYSEETRHINSPYSKDPVNSQNDVFIQTSSLTNNQSGEVSVSFDRSDSLMYAMNKNGSAAQGQLWTFNKSYHNQLAKDVSLLREGTDLSPWSLVTSSLAGQATGNPSTEIYKESLALEGSTGLPFFFPCYAPYFGSDADNPSYSEVFKTHLFGGLRTVGTVTEFLCVYPWRAVNALKTSIPGLRDGDFGLSATSGNDFGVVESFPILSYRQSKVIMAPKGYKFSDFTGTVRYIPKSGSDVTLEILLVFVGKRTDTKKVNVTLKGYDITAGRAATPYYPLSEEFSIPSSNSDQVMITVSALTKHDFEVLGIDFNVKS